MHIVVDFVPSSFSRIECLVKNKDQVLIGRSTGSVADTTNDAKQIMCVAFGTAPVVPEGQCE